MEFFEKNKEIWNEHFHRESLEYPNEEVVRFLVQAKKKYKGGVMLDWGCATGRHTILGCKLGFNVIAADYVKHCVDITKAKVEKECEITDGKVIQYCVNKDVDLETVPDETIDVLLAWGCAFINPPDKQKQMLKNMNRMLKKGGSVFCDFRTTRDSIFTDIGEKVADNTFIIQTENKKLKGLCLTILELEDLRELLIECGFQIESIERYEFTQENQRVNNSWWHVQLTK